MKKSLAMLLLAAMCLSLCACAAGSTKTGAEPAVILGKAGADGDAWVSRMNGEAVKIKGEIVRCYLLTDRGTVIALTDDGALFRTTVSDTEDRTTLAENVNKVNVVKDSGIIFTDTKNYQYRLKFGGVEPLKLGEDVAMAVANDTLSLMYADGDGNICILPEDEEEPEKIANWKSPTVQVESISNDGKTALWIEINKDKNESVSYLYHDGEKTKLTTLDTSSSSATIRFNKSQNAFAVADIHSDEFYFQNKGKELVKVRLSDDLGSSTLYTSNGNLIYDNGKAIDGLYITVDADNGDNVYYVTAEGEREKLLSNVKEIDIQSGFIGYIDEDDNLRVAKLNGTELKDEKKIAGDVAALRLSKDGKYLYYVKGVDTERNIGALYRYTLKSEKSEKIASETYIYRWFGFYLSYFYVSEDGRTVYYFEDVDEIEDTYTNYGTLKCATVGKDPVKIGTDILVQTPNDGMKGGYIDSSGFVYSKYVSLNADEEPVVNWMFYNGKDCVTLAKDVLETASSESSATNTDVPEMPVPETPVDETPAEPCPVG